MDTSGLGGGIMLAIAAGLWLLYLVPSWLRRRDLSHVDHHAKVAEREERAAARLARVEAARLERIAEHEARLAAIPMLAISAPTGPVAARPAVHAERSAAPMRASQHVVAQRPTAARASSARPGVGRATAHDLAFRRRRARLLGTLVLLASLVAFVVQVSLIVTTGAVAGSWLVLGAGLLGGTSALALLRQLADATRPAAAPVARRTTLSYSTPVAQAAATEREHWTPVPVPKPLYLSRPVQQPAATADALAELQAAAAAAEHALRVAHAEPEVAPMPAAAHSRFASMGVVDPTSVEHTDLDAVLQRRRSAG